MSEVEKNSFITLTGKGGHSGLMSSELSPNLEGVVRSSTAVVQRGRDQFMDILLIGDVSGSQHHQASGSSDLGSMTLWAAYSYLIQPGGGFTICKTAQR